MAEQQKTHAFFSVFPNSFGKKQEIKTKSKTGENYLIGLIFMQDTEGYFFTFIFMWS